MVNDSPHGPLETREDGSRASPSLAGVDLRKLVNMDTAAGRPAPPRPAGERMMH